MYRSPGHARVIMLYVLYYALGVVAWNARAAFSTPVTYDQRQTGDVNVQIHLKDVQVVALVDSELLDDYTDYDYAYDYSDFTIKPIVKPTTSSTGSPTSSVKPWTTWPTNPPKTSTTVASTTVESVSLSSPTFSNVQSETSAKPTIDPSSSSASDASKANSTIYNLGNISEINKTDNKLRIKDSVDGDSLNVADIIKNEENQVAESIAMIQENLKKACPVGYALNNKGRCRSTQNRRRISFVPLTMKLGSKLSGKPRLPVRKDLPIRVYKSEPQ